MRQELKEILIVAALGLVGGVLVGTLIHWLVN